MGIALILGPYLMVFYLSPRPIPQRPLTQECGEPCVPPNATYVILYCKVLVGCYAVRWFLYSSEQAVNMHIDTSYVGCSRVQQTSCEGCFCQS